MQDCIGQRIYSVGDNSMKNKRYSLETQNTIIHYSIARAKRKTLGITVDITGEVKVSAPLYIDEKQIIEIVENKADWIIKKMGIVKEMQKNIVLRQFVNGEKILYLGKEHELKIVEMNYNKTEVILQNDTITVYLPEGMQKESKKQLIRKTLVLWYKKCFSDIIDEKIREYSLQLKVAPLKVVIKEQKTRWGSCSSKGNINLNWRLVMAPISVIDYVIVHELCHMKIMNHSKDFWNQVELIMPNYNVRRKWLRENGNKLIL